MWHPLSPKGLPFGQLLASLGAERPLVLRVVQLLIFYIFVCSRIIAVANAVAKISCIPKMSFRISLSQIRTNAKQNIRRQTFYYLQSLRVWHCSRHISNHMNMIAHNFYYFNLYLVPLACFLNRDSAKNFQLVTSHHFVAILWCYLNVLPIRADRAPTMFIFFHFLPHEKFI